MHDAVEVHVNDVPEGLDLVFLAAILDQPLRQYEHVQSIERGFEPRERGMVCDIDLRVVQAAKIRAIFTLVIERAGAGSPNVNCRATPQKLACDPVADAARATDHKRRLAA